MRFITPLFPKTIPIHLISIDIFLFPAEPKLCCKTILHNHSLDHVENRLVFVQPYVMVRYRHCLKSHTLGVFEERVWTPDLCEPLHGQQSVL